MAALICAAAIYGGLVPVGRQEAYASVVPLSAAVSLDCRIASSPSRTAGGRGAAYSCRADVFRAFGRLPGGAVSGGSSGRLDLSLPASLVESLYPGRLYSRTSGGLLMESGACFRLTGRWNAGRKVFEVSSAESLGWGRGLPAFLFRARAVARLQFRRLVYSWGRAGGLVLALLSGSREYLDPLLLESFRRAGLSHVLALSGMHLSFFSSLLGFSSVHLLGRRRSFLPVLLGLACFVFFAGLSPSLLRAFLFVLLLSCCSRLHVSGVDGRDALGAVFLVHALLRPQDLGSAAFMLSYAAMAGLLLLTGPLARLLAPLLPPVLAAPFAASLSAFLATAPVSLLLFGSVAPAGILASVVVSPLVGIFMAASLASLAASLVCPALAPACSLLLGALLFLMEQAAGFFAAFPLLGAG